MSYYQFDFDYSRQAQYKICETQSKPLRITVNDWLKASLQRPDSERLYITMPLLGWSTPST